jgi:hypothetical protein
MQQVWDAIGTIESMKVSIAVHYHGRFRERSMKENRSAEDISRKGAKSPRDAKKLTTKTQSTQRKKEERFVLFAIAFVLFVPSW